MTQLMIDRIRVRGPLRHKAVGDPHSYQYKDGRVANYRNSVSPRGGNLLATVNVQSRGHVDEDGFAPRLQFDCCPAKVLQGHNIFGSGELRDLVYEVLLLVIEHLGLRVDPKELRLWRGLQSFHPEQYCDDDDLDADQALQRWRNRQVWITEVHITGNFYVEEQYIADLIQAVDEHVGHGKQRPYPTSITLGTGGDRRSKHRALLIYGKFLEVARHLGDFAPAFRQLLLDAACNSLRVEARLFWNGLDQRDRLLLGNWQDGDVDRFFWEIVDKFGLKYAIQPVLSAHELQELTKQEQMVYLLWRHGYPPERFFESRSTVLGYQEKIKQKVGVDILSRRKSDRLPEVSLEEILVPSNLKPVPRWAYDTPYYVEPIALTNVLAREFVAALAYR